MLIDLGEDKVRGSLPRPTKSKIPTFDSFLGSTLDIWRMKMPVHMTRKARTIVTIWVTLAFKPW